MVKRVECDEERRELVVYFDARAASTPRRSSAQVLWVLLQQPGAHQRRPKGRGLEQRVMDCRIT